MPQICSIILRWNVCDECGFASLVELERGDSSRTNDQSLIYVLTHILAYLSSTIHPLRLKGKVISLA